MPYFVYNVSNNLMVKQLDCLAEFESYKDAKNFARDKRQADPSSDPADFKVIFADNKLAAEEQLQENREAPILMEWEK